MMKPKYNNSLDNLQVPKSEFDRIKRINYEKDWIIYDLRTENFKKEQTIARLHREIEERNKLIETIDPSSGLEIEKIQKMEDE